MLGFLTHRNNEIVRVHCFSQLLGLGVIVTQSKIASIVISGYCCENPNGRRINNLGRQIELLDLANKNVGWPAKLKFHTDSQ